MNLVLKVCFLTFLNALTISYVLGSSLEDADKLYEKLTFNQTRYTRGKYNQSEPTTVLAHFYFISLMSLDELTGKVSVAGFFNMQWVDERMVWNPIQYGGKASIKLPQDEIWRPLVVLANSYGETKKLGFDYIPVEFSYQGIALWLPGDMFDVRCAVDLTNFPFDTQNCYLQFVPFHTYINEIIFTLSASIYTSQFVENRIWEVANISVNTVIQDGAQVLYVKMELSRRPGFYMISMIMPIFLMGVLNIFVFLLPPEFGDRIGYSITVLLSIAVFQTIASDSLPNTSYPAVPVLSIKLFADVVCSCVITIFTVLVLRVYNTDPEIPVSVCIRKLTSCLIRRSGKSTNCICSCKGKRKWAVHDVSEMDSQEYTNKEDKITWKDAGKAMDMIFATSSILLFAISNLSFMLYIKHNEH